MTNNSRYERGNKLILPQTVTINDQMHESFCDYITGDNFDFNRVRSLKFYSDVKRKVTSMIQLATGLKQLTIGFESSIV